MRVPLLNLIQTKLTCITFSPFPPHEHPFPDTIGGPSSSIAIGCAYFHVHCSVIGNLWSLLQFVSLSLVEKLESFPFQASWKRVISCVMSYSAKFGDWISPQADHILSLEDGRCSANESLETTETLARRGKDSDPAW